MEENLTIKGKILTFLDSAGIKKVDFFNTTGIKDSNFKGKHLQSQLGGDMIVKILTTYPNLSADWLLTGNGPMLKTKGSNQSCSVVEDAIPDHKDKKNKAIYPKKQEENSITEALLSEPSVSYTPSKGAPYYDVDFLGGFDLTFNNQTINPEYNIDFKPFNKPGVTWVNITGHSMEPKINHGDIIALKECRLEDVQYGEIYAVVLDTIRTVKILRKSNDPNRMRYVPINEENYDEQEYDNSRILRIFEVLGNISRFM